MTLTELVQFTPTVPRYSQSAVHMHTTKKRKQPQVRRSGAPPFAVALNGERRRFTKLRENQFTAWSYEPMYLKR